MPCIDVSVEHKQVAAAYLFQRKRIPSYKAAANTSKRSTRMSEMTVPAELNQASEVSAALASRFRQRFTAAAQPAGEDRGLSVSTNTNAPRPPASTSGGATSPPSSPGALPQQDHHDTEHEHHHHHHLHVKDAVPEGLRHTSEVAAELASRYVDGGLAPAKWGAAGRVSCSCRGAGACAVCGDQVD